MFQPPIQALNDFSPIALKRKQYSFCDVFDSEDLEVLKSRFEESDENAAFDQFITKMDAYDFAWAL